MAYKCYCDLCGKDTGAFHRVTPPDDSYKSLTGTIHRVDLCDDCIMAAIAWWETFWETRKKAVGR